MATKKATPEREVLVLVTYRIKKDYAPKGLHRDDVVLVVRNDENVNYIVTLRRNGAHSCTCEGKAVWGKNCYHLASCKEQFNARIVARKAAKAVEMPAQSVVKATPVAIEAYVMSAQVREKLAATAKPAEEVVETPAQLVERKQAWDKMRCCLIFLDTREPVDPEAYAEMLRPQREAEERMMSAALTKNKAFSIL